MRHFKEAIRTIKEDENLVVNYDSHKLEQKTRNRYKTLITEALLADIAHAIDELDYEDDEVIFGRIEKGIGVGVWTEHGYIPIFIEASMKGLEFDIKTAAQEYKSKCELKAAEAAERLEAKQLKMAQDNIRREKKRQERERLEAEKLARLEAQANGQTGDKE